MHKTENMTEEQIEDKIEEKSDYNKENKENKDNKENKKIYKYMQNRELSWLKFNERVLEEAQDDSVPIYEKLKFISIFTSNLDEFFMIRVGSLNDLMLMGHEIDGKTGMTPRQQLDKIYEAVIPLYEKRDKIYQNVAQGLKKYGVCHTSIKTLDKSDRKYMEKFYLREIAPILSPQIIDSRHPFPHLTNKYLYYICEFTDEGNKYGLIPVSEVLPSYVLLPGSIIRYVLTSEIIAHYSKDIFKDLKTSTYCLIAVTRNADITPEDEIFDIEDDYRESMKKVLKKRERLSPVRLEVKGHISKNLSTFLLNKLHLSKEQLFQCVAPITLDYVYPLTDEIPSSLLKQISYSTLKPATVKYEYIKYDNNIKNDNIIKYDNHIKKDNNIKIDHMKHDNNKHDNNEQNGIIARIKRKDILLSFPYEAMDPFLNLLKESAFDPFVLSIKITIYRLSKNSRIIDYLCMAAENKKEVLVLIELKARFDEKNNIEWAQRLEESGCKVIFGFEGYKVHSKICLITRREKNKIGYITQIGTGNYNEKTAKLYTDLCLMTANLEIGQEANEFFKNMSISNLKGNYQELLVAPYYLKNNLLALIDGEIDKAKRREPSGITIKSNSLTDKDIMRKLSDASCAGVPIKLLIRGICCLLPGIPDKTENIKVISIVGRFLEHSRVYVFGVGKDTKIYISSADMMGRNMVRRVEIACPILDEDSKEKILHMLKILSEDNVKARTLTKQGNYKKRKDKTGYYINAQQYLLDEAVFHSEIYKKKRIFIKKIITKVKL